MDLVLYIIANSAIMPTVTTKSANDEPITPLQSFEELSAEGDNEHPEDSSVRGLVESRPSQVQPGGASSDANVLLPFPDAHNPLESPFASDTATSSGSDSTIRDDSLSAYSPDMDELGDNPGVPLNETQMVTPESIKRRRIAPSQEATHLSAKVHSTSLPDLNPLDYDYKPDSGLSVRGKNFFITAPQCTIPPTYILAKLTTEFEVRLDSALVVRELHKDGSFHLHVSLCLGTRSYLGNEFCLRIFDKHANIQVLSGSRERIYDALCDSVEHDYPVSYCLYAADHKDQDLALAVDTMCADATLAGDSE